MAHQQVYQAYPQNKGTLVPGQTISVNNYTVQVERYLSQGGFAHVYLVRTPQPVYNTTHHVLKRIAVANESMLTDVKKEVDIMRLLKGHPNIVHLIDAAWHKLPSNTFEVFILMEFCPGGGIIDMMNRRLRERLTEAEILQIFVDVCEGVAYMHNSRPPLLHRDLKVENILQSSPTSFKLCDFGSATTVSNPPTTMQEIRSVEADLNRHTTLQYRAPEMVDVYAKRPVNEKSDVWALGVLLYKLCFYTTPFEEHGPLAIINVQYRIPPYPVYSQDMNMLIASMLREHGAQRPSVFELLNHVHRLRGTKSKFSYNIPLSQPLVPPHAKQLSPSPNPMDGLVTYNVPPVKSPSPNRVPPNQGIQARDRVLEAIAPMRRGRPTPLKESQSGISRPVSPQRVDQPRQINQGGYKDQPYNDFTVEQEKAWKAATDTQRTPEIHSNSRDTAWAVDKPSQDANKVPKDKPLSFGDDFAENLWSASDPNLHTPLQPRLTPSPNRLAMSVQRTSEAPVSSLAFTGPSRVRPKQDRLILSRDARDKDAFEGLGLMANVPKSTPTLGEARKLRTGLAMMSTPASNQNQSDFLRDGDKTRANPQRPTPSPQLPPRYLSTTPLVSQSISPGPSPGPSSSPSQRSSHSASGPGPPSATSTEGGTIESRYPSLEELDAQFSPPLNPLYPSAINDATARYAYQQAKQTGNRPQLHRTGNIGASETGGKYLKHSTPSNMPYSADGTRSQQVTGIAMRDAKDSNKRFPDNNSVPSWNPAPKEKNNAAENDIFPRKDMNLQPKPLVVRKHQSSTSMNPAFTSSSNRDSEILETRPKTPSSADKPPKLPTRPQANTSPRDWLTGDDHEEIKPHVTPELPVLRNSPSKRASFIENNDFRIVSSSAAQFVTAPAPNVDEPPSAAISPTISKFRRNFPVVESFDTDRQEQTTTDKALDRRSLKKEALAKKDVEHDSSSADEGPEDPASVMSAPQKRQMVKARGRQSSVHDLVHQYGGGLIHKENEKEAQKETSTSGNQNISNDSTSRKPRPLAAPVGLVPPISYTTTQKTPSPTAVAFKPSVSQSTSIFANSERPQPPPPATKPVVGFTANNVDIKSPSSSRARPQSMFIFPSKSTDSSSASRSNNLVPPPEPRPRATRRTSISDMVQHYEAIGSTVNPVASIHVASPTIPIPTAPKTPVQPTENNSSSKPSSGPGKSTSLKMTPSSESSSRHDDMVPTMQSQSKVPPRQMDNFSRSPAKVHRKLSSDKETTTFSHTMIDDNQRGKNTSVKTVPLMSGSVTRMETSGTRPTKPSASQNTFIPNRSPRKLHISLSQDPTVVKAEEPRSPSPERPYQGVGKLIDQWQKKSAEADENRSVQPMKRGDILNKRAGLVYGDDR